MKYILTVILLCIPGCSGLSVTAGIGMGGLSLTIERHKLPFETPAEAPTDAPEAEVPDER
jgi:hypothetical protein